MKAVVLRSTTSDRLLSRREVDVQVKGGFITKNMYFSLKLPLHQHLTPHLFKADEFEADF